MSTSQLHCGRRETDAALVSGFSWLGGCQALRVKIISQVGTVSRLCHQWIPDCFGFLNSVCVCCYTVSSDLGAEEHLLRWRSDCRVARLPRAVGMYPGFRLGLSNKLNWLVKKHELKFGTNYESFFKASLFYNCIGTWILGKLVLMKLEQYQMSWTQRKIMQCSKKNNRNFVLSKNWIIYS